MIKFFSPVARPTENDTYWTKYTSKARIVTTADLVAEPFTLDGKRYDHGHLTLTLRRNVEVPLVDYLKAAETNALGYQNGHHIQVASNLRALHEMGVTHIYESHEWGGPGGNLGYVALSWQQYDDKTYCGEPRINACHDKPSNYVALGPFLEQLGKLVRGGHPTEYPRSLDHTLANPTEVYETLSVVGVVLTHPFRGNSGTYYRTRVRGPRMRFLTDTP